MALTQLTDNLNIIQALASKPNQEDGLTYSQLQAKFDEAGNTIKLYINDTLIAELEATTAAANLGIVAPTGLTGTNIKAVLDDFVSKILLKANTTTFTPTADYHPATKKYIDDISAAFVLGELSSGSVTDDMLSDTAGQIKAVVATNTSDISTNTANILVNTTNIENQIFFNVMGVAYYG